MAKTPVDEILCEVASARKHARDEKGLRALPDYNMACVDPSLVAPFIDESQAETVRADAETDGSLTYTHLMTEKFAIAASEATKFRPKMLRLRLLELASLCVEWIEAIDRRSKLFRDTKAIGTKPSRGNSITKPPKRPDNLPEDGYWDGESWKYPPKSGE